MEDQSRRHVVLAGMAALATPILSSGPAQSQRSTMDGREAATVAGSRDDPITILGSKLVAWFDSTDRSTLFVDMAGTVQIADGGTVAVQRAKNDPAFTRSQAAAAQRPIWSTSAYNAGSGLMYDATARSAAGCSLVSASVTALGGKRSFAIASSFSVGAGSDAFYMVALNDQSNPNVDPVESGSASLIHVFPGGKTWSWAAARNHVDYARSGGETDYDAPTRLYYNAGASSDEIFEGQLSGVPRSRGSASVGNTTARTLNIVFGASRWGGGVHAGRYVEQHTLLCNAALSAEEIAALDAYLRGAQGRSVVVPALKSSATTGSMRVGSAILTVADPAGFAVGDRVIVEIGGEATTGYGSVGVGGVWPQLSAPTEAAVLALTTSTPDTYMRAVDSGKIYKARADGAGYYAWDKTLFYSRYAQPLSLVAEITALAGNVLTLDKTASISTANANVYVDNAAILNAISGPDGLTVSLPAGTFRQSTTWRMHDRRNWTVVGEGPSATVLQCPRGVPSDNIRLFQCVEPTIRDLKVVGNHAWQGMGLEYSGPNSLSGYGAGIRVDSTRGARLLDVHGRDTPGVFISFASSSGLADRCRLDYTVAQQRYIGWQFQASNSYGDETVEFRDCVFDSDFLVTAWETFSSTNVRFVRPRSRNGIFASNSSSGFLFEEPLITITANCRDTTVLSPIHYGNGVIGINVNIATSSGGTNTAKGAGGIIRNPTIDIQGFMDAGGNVMRAVSISSAPDVLVEGTYHSGAKSSHKGLIRAPIAAQRRDLYSAGGPEIVCDAQRMQVTGIRLLAYGVEGSGRWPTPYKPSISIYPADKTGCAITNTVTGGPSPDVSPLKGNNGNISNVAYDALP